MGNPSADILAMKWLRKRYTPKVEIIVVYGSTIKALTAIQRLMRAGISGSRLMAVLPDSATMIDEIEDALVGVLRVVFVIVTDNVCAQVAEKLVSKMQDANVKIQWGYLLSDISLNRSGFIQSVDLRRRDGDVVTAVAPESKEGEEASVANESVSVVEETGELRIMCMALLCCGQMQCDRDVFAAVNDSGLVFDGGLVVDAVRWVAY